MNHSAKIIQQKFWYNRARWNTKRRLAQRLLNSGLFIAKGMILVEVLEKIGPLFELWTHRMFSRRLRCVLSAFLIPGILEAVYQDTDGAQELSESAVSLAEVMKQCMEEDTPREIFIKSIMHYVPLYNDWFKTNESAVHLTLTQLAVKRTVNAYSKRPTRECEIQLSAELTFLIGGDAEFQRLIMCRPEIQVVYSLQNSRFWGPGNISIYRMMHEVLVDEGFVLDRSTVLTAFSETYRRIASQKSFLMDLRSVLMFAIRDPVALTAMAGALHIEGQTLDIDEYASRLIPAIISATPINTVAETIRRKWSEVSDDVISKLEFLREAALDLRYAYAVEDLEECRRRVSRHPSGFNYTHANLMIAKSTETKYTEAWLMRCLRNHPMLYRLAKGDPFALLKVFDQEIVRFVLNGSFDTPVPEILLFDLDRMRALHSQILDAKESQAVMRMVLSDEECCSNNTRLKEVAASLRNMIFICRFQHGLRVAELIQACAMMIYDTDTAMRLMLDS